MESGRRSVREDGFSAILSGEFQERGTQARFSLRQAGVSRGSIRERSEPERFPEPKRHGDAAPGTPGPTGPEIVHPLDAAWDHRDISRQHEPEGAPAEGLEGAIPGPFPLGVDADPLSSLKEA